METITRRLAASAMTLAGALAASASIAAEPAPAAAPARGDAVSSTQAPGASALRAVRDKETGKLRRATEAELAEMLAAEKAQREARGQADPATAPPAVMVRQHANGMVSAVLGTEHLVTVQVVRGADGRLVRSHTHPAYEHPVARPQQPQRPTE